jgi:hypothetical protein
MGWTCSWDRGNYGTAVYPLETQTGLRTGLAQGGVRDASTKGRKLRSAQRDAHKRSCELGFGPIQCNSKALCGV